MLHITLGRWESDGDLELVLRELKVEEDTSGGTLLLWECSRKVTCNPASSSHSIFITLHSTSGFCVSPIHDPVAHLYRFSDFLQAWEASSHSNSFFKPSTPLLSPSSKYPHILPSGSHFFLNSCIFLPTPHTATHNDHSASIPPSPPTPSSMSDSSQTTTPKTPSTAAT